MACIFGETITSRKELAKITGCEFTNFKSIGRVVDKEGRPAKPNGFRTLSKNYNIPTGSFNGLYVIAVKINGRRVIVYGGSCCAKSGLHHRINTSEFNYKQNEGGINKCLQGPSHVWMTMHAYNAKAKYYVSYCDFPTAKYSMQQVRNKEKYMLDKVDFIANTQNNGCRRLRGN